MHPPRTGISLIATAIAMYPHSTVNTDVEVRVRDEVDDFIESATLPGADEQEVVAHVHRLIPSYSCDSTSTLCHFVVRLL